MTLYVTRVYAYACDVCEAVSDDILVATKGGARSAWPVVEAEGWTRRDGLHYCPDHRDWWDPRRVVVAGAPASCHVLNVDSAPRRLCGRPKLSIYPT